MATIEGDGQAGSASLAHRAAEIAQQFPDFYSKEKLEALLQRKKKAVPQKLVPSSGVALTNWNLWRMQRRTIDAISVSDAVALTFGVDPRKIGSLSAQTKPSRALYLRRLKYLQQAIQAGHPDLVLIDPPVPHTLQPEPLLRFSKFMDFIYREHLPVPPALIELEHAMRQFADVQAETSTQVQAATVSSQKHADLPTILADELDDKSRKEKHLEITIGAMAFLIQQYATQATPGQGKALLRNGKLNFSALGGKLADIIRERLGHDEAGFKDDTLRKTIGRAVKHFPEHQQRDSFSSEE